MPDAESYDEIMNKRMVVIIEFFFITFSIFLISLLIKLYFHVSKD